VTEEESVKIQVLGTGCAKCKQLTANAEKAVADLGLGVAVEKVEDIREIMKFSVMSTPALVVDGKVRSVGKVLTPDAVKDLLRQ
jgi:small redox-active disulfide protein 2